jgi:hypothetical protein
MAAARPQVVGRNIDVDESFIHVVEKQRSEVSTDSTKAILISEQKRYEIRCASFAEVEF